MSTNENTNRWLALYVLCAGVLMIVLDATIVNVALPTIKEDLDFSQSELAWVVNAYLIAFGGLLLLSGRIGDLIGHRKIFLIGLGVFTVASLACGRPPPRPQQLALVFFRDPADRPRDRRARAAARGGPAGNRRGRQRGRPGRRARHRRADACGLHDPRRRGEWLGLHPDARSRRSFDRARCGVRPASGPHRKPADAAAAVPLAQRVGGEHRDEPARGRDVRPVLPRRALPPADPGLRRAPSWPRVPAGDARDGLALARVHRQAEHALRPAERADCRAVLPAGRDAVVRAHARGRPLLDRPAPGDARVRRRGRRLVPRADDAGDVGSHAERRGPGLRPREHHRAGGRRDRPRRAGDPVRRADAVAARRRRGDAGGAERRLPPRLPDRGGAGGGGDPGGVHGAARRAAGAGAGRGAPRRAGLRGGIGVRRSISRSVEVDAPPQRVWGELADTASYPGWNPFIKRLEGELREGERIEGEIEPPDGRAITFKPTVIAVTPNRELRWLGHLLVRGLFDGEHRFEIEDLGDGRSRLTQSERFAGVLVRPFGGTLAKTERGFEAMNRDLKERVEVPA